jgi:hypothetical protein
MARTGILMVSEKEHDSKKSKTIKDLAEIPGALATSQNLGFGL